MDETEKEKDQLKNKLYDVSRAYFMAGLDVIESNPRDPLLEAKFNEASINYRAMVVDVERFIHKYPHYSGEFSI